VTLPKISGDVHRMNRDQDLSAEIYFT